MKTVAQMKRSRTQSSDQNSGRVTATGGIHDRLSRGLVQHCPKVESRPYHLAALPVRDPLRDNVKYASLLRERLFPDLDVVSVDAAASAARGQMMDEFGNAKRGKTQGAISDGFRGNLPRKGFSFRPLCRPSEGRFCNVRESFNP